MILKQYRLYDNGDDTISILYYKDQYEQISKYIYIIEDEYRDKKVKGETRIPEGLYEIKMRKEGGFYEKYCKHKVKFIRELTIKYGIPHLQDVPMFEYILIHCGNTDDDTNGCLCTGLYPNNNSHKSGFISESINAYIILMLDTIIPAIKNEEKIYIEIIDFDRNLTFE